MSGLFRPGEVEAVLCVSLDSSTLEPTEREDFGEELLFDDTFRTSSALGPVRLLSGPCAPGKGEGIEMSSKGHSYSVKQLMYGSKLGKWHQGKCMRVEPSLEVARVHEDNTK